MSVLDYLTSFIAPYDCLSCGAEGSLLCENCRRVFPALPPRCFNCRQLSSGARTCRNCYAKSQLFAVRAVTPYRGITKELIWRLKFHGARSAAAIMAHDMAALLPEEPGVLLVPVPTTTLRARQRGYDQAALLARALAKQKAGTYAAVLARQGRQHQVGARRDQRLAQLQQVFQVIRPASVRSRHIILIDDVLTTGATLSAAAKVLKAAGAKRVDGLVFAQA